MVSILSEVMEQALLEHIYSKLAERNAILVTLDQFIELVSERTTMCSGNLVIDYAAEQPALIKELDYVEQCAKIRQEEDSKVFDTIAKAASQIEEEPPFDVPETTTQDSKPEEEDYVPYELSTPVKFSTGNNFIDCVVEAYDTRNNVYTLKAANGPTLYESVHPHRVYPHSIANAVKSQKVEFKSPDHAMLVSFLEYDHEAPGQVTHLGIYGSETLEDGSTLFASYGLYANGDPYIYVGVSNDQGQALAEALPNEDLNQPFVVDYKTDRYEVYLLGE